MGREHWVETTIGNIFELKYGKGLPKETRIKGKLNVYGSNGIVGKHNNSITKGETIIIGRKGSVGEVHYSPDKCWPIDTTYYIDEFPQKIPAGYWFLFLQSLSLGRHEKSSAIPGINRQDVYQIKIPLPPLNEQQRIVAKLDALLPKVKHAQTRLAKIPGIVKKFRQSVLAAACSGRLTEDWREGKDLPEWEEVLLKEIADIKGGVTKDTSKQKNTDIEVPYLRVANVQRGYLDLTEMKTIKIPKEKLDDFLLKNGDVLLTEGGDIDKLGRGWIWEDQIKICSYQNHIFRARLFNPENESKYVSWFANSMGVDFFFQSGKQTTGIASVNKTMVSNLPILLPPQEEQHEIVRRVERLFALADSLEAKYSNAMQRVAKIEQALLAKAFRGELAPPDPHDEPADVLLQRILAEKVKLEAGPKTRKTKKKQSHR